MSIFHKTQLGFSNCLQHLTRFLSLSIWKRVKQLIPLCFLQRFLTGSRGSSLNHRWNWCFSRPFLVVAYLISQRVSGLPLSRQWWYCHLSRIFGHTFRHIQALTQILLSQSRLWRSKEPRTVGRTTPYRRNLLLRSSILSRLLVYRILRLFVWPA